MASGTPSAQVRLPVGDLVFFTPPPPTYADTILLGEKLKIMLRQKIYKEASAGGSRRRTAGRRRVGQNFELFFEKLSLCRELLHSAEITLFHMLIHCEISFAQNQTLSPNLIHYRSYTLSLYIAEAIPHLNTLPNRYPVLVP